MCDHRIYYVGLFDFNLRYYNDYFSVIGNYAMDPIFRTILHILSCQDVLYAVLNLQKQLVMKLLFCESKNNTPQETILSC